MIEPDRVVHRFFPPSVAMELVRIACEMPESLGRSLCLWDCSELAMMLEVRGVVDSISPQTVQRILFSRKLKPWRFHPWLRPKARDQEFIDRTNIICDIYTRALAEDEIVLCLDEKTSLQPRTRLSPTKAALPGSPVLVEHEYERKGALNLFAAFNTRTGCVIGSTYSRKRQREFIDFLEKIENETDPAIMKIHLVCDNLKVHSGKEVARWLRGHPRFCFHFTPVHCSWMNQVEQWFSILQRKRFSIANFSSIQALAERITEFISQWNQHAAPFKWTKHSFDKVLQKAEQELRKAA